MAADGEHRARVAKVRAQVAKDLATLWRLSFDSDDVERSWRRFEVGAVPLVMAGYALSAREAGRYIDVLRGEAGFGRSQLAAPPVLERGRLERALGYTARVGTLVGIRSGRTPQEAGEVALVRTVGTAVRLVTEGANAMVMATVGQDRQAKGWRRVTDGDPCDWCASQAALGVVSQGYRFGAHDHCGCTAAPAY